jgi:hypothetical protein
MFRIPKKDRGPRWVLAAVLCLAPAANALACAFHGYTPNPTLVDLILATEQAVVARPSSDGTYEIVEALLGPGLGDIPMSASAEFKRNLSADTGVTALLVRDGAYGPWIEAAVMDTRFRGLIDIVIENQRSWQWGEEVGRIQLFAGLVNDPNPNIQRLALQELDRLPYATLRKVRVPPIRNLKEDIASGRTDQRPIRVLLAGLSNDPSFGPILAEATHRAVLQDKPYLGAYITAMIELHGKPAVDPLIATYLASGGTSQSVQTKILDALSLTSKTARRDVRRAISQQLTELVRTRPEISELVIAQFGPPTQGRFSR